MSTPNKHVILLTGASSGIGKGVAIRLAEQGHRVLITGRQQERLNALQSQFPGQIQAFQADLRLHADVDRLIDWTLQQAPQGPDILIHSAGQAILGLAQNVPESAFQEGFQTQVLALLQMIQRFLPFWTRRKSAQVLVLSSGVAYRGLPGAAAYCVPKAAQLSLLESLAVELKPKGVMVTTVSPGLTNTNFQHNAQIFGPLPVDYTNAKTKSVQCAVDHVMKALSSTRPHFEYSLRARFARILNALTPNITNRLLARQVARQEAKL